jgi:hypothetical protein
MVSAYQIGLIVALAVGVLASALIIAWRDAGGNSSRRRETGRRNNRSWCRRQARKPDRSRDRVP